MDIYIYDSLGYTAEINKHCKQTVFHYFFFFKNGGAQDRLLNVVRTESLTTHRGWVQQGLSGGRRPNPKRPEFLLEGARETNTQTSFSLSLSDLPSPTGGQGHGGLGGTTEGHRWGPGGHPVLTGEGPSSCSCSLTKELWSCGWNPGSWIPGLYSGCILVAMARVSCWPTMLTQRRRLPALDLVPWGRRTDAEWWPEQDGGWDGQGVGKVPSCAVRVFGVW